LIPPRLAPGARRCGVCGRAGWGGGPIASSSATGGLGYALRRNQQRGHEAAISPPRTHSGSRTWLIYVALAAYLTCALPHLIFHLAHQAACGLAGGVPAHRIVAVARHRHRPAPHHPGWPSTRPRVPPSATALGPAPLTARARTCDHGGRIAQRRTEDRAECHFGATNAITQQGVTAAPIGGDARKSQVGAMVTECDIPCL